MSVALRAITVLCLVSMIACAKKSGVANKAYTDVCEANAECKSGHCVQGSDGASFCSQVCGGDSDCSSTKTLYCCEQVDAAALCIQPTTPQCRTPKFGDDCQGTGDPFCARGAFACLDVGGRNICTFSCTADTDCTDVAGSTCSDVGGQKTCVTPDLNNLTRLTSNCAGDRECAAGQRCLVRLDNDLSPFGWVTVCASDTLGSKPLGAACTAGNECDHGLCYRNICTASCVNDSFCGAGRVCEPVDFPFTNNVLMQSGSSLLQFCAPQKGTFAPCDSNASVCATNEICQWQFRYDASFANVCSEPDALPAGSPAVIATRAGPGEACSAQTTTGTWENLISEGGTAKVKLCGSGFCATGLDYCITPCRINSDCAGTGPEPTVCVYGRFFNHCERVNTSQKGTALGGACSGMSPTAANATCASGSCDLNTSTCVARLDDGMPCTRSSQCTGGDVSSCAAPECKSGFCLNDTCATLCRDDTSCAAGSVCEAQLDIADLFGTPTSTADDAIDTPTFCTPFAAVSPRKDCPAQACTDPGTVCRPLLGGDGAYRAVCATSATGADLGAACKADDDCKSHMCVGFGTSTLCTTVCADDTDCAGGTACVAVSLTGRAVDKVCAAPPAAAALGAACTRGADCSSFLCVDNKCSALCPKNTTLGTACAGGTCARVGLTIDGRLTTERFDDRLGFVDACVQGATAWVNSGNFSDCAAPKRFVFRPSGAALVGSCQTPVDSTLADGVGCQASTQCASGLCVDRVCRPPCSVTPSDSCGALKCDVAARALLNEDNGVTAAVQACQPVCTADTDCLAGSKCTIADTNGNRFCRRACVGNNDCIGGTCSGDLGAGLRVCQ